MSFPSQLVPVSDDSSLGPQAVAARVARNQFGFVTFGQLLDCGWSPTAIERARARELLRRIHDGVYEFPGAPGSWERELVSSMLAVGPPVAAARGTALAVHGVRRFRRAGPKHLLVPYGRGSRPTVDTVIMHRSRTLAPEDLEVVDGIVVTTVTRSVLDIGADHVNRQTQRWLASEAIRTGAATFGSFYEQIERAGRIRGKAQLMRELQRLDPQIARGRSGGEVGLFELATSAGLPEPVLNHPVLDAYGNLIAEIDVALVPLKVGFEHDGEAFHATPDELVKDRHRDNRLKLELGWDITRFAARLVRDHPDRVIAQMRKAHELARSRQQATEG